jgi:hypothetical protein
VVTLKESEIHNTFLKQYLKKSEATWRAYWRRMVFTGQGMPPEQVETQEELLEYVANTEGAVGYIDTEAPLDNVTIIEVK